MCTEGIGRRPRPFFYALMGTTMAPGFAFADYAGGTRAALIAQYPEYGELITALTPE